MDNDIRDEELLLVFLRKCMPESFEMIDVSLDQTLIRVRTEDSSMDFAFSGQGDFKWVR